MSTPKRVIPNNVIERLKKHARRDATEMIELARDKKRPLSELLETQGWCSIYGVPLDELGVPFGRMKEAVDIYERAFRDRVVAER